MLLRTGDPLDIRTQQMFEVHVWGRAKANTIDGFHGHQFRAGSCNTHLDCNQLKRCSSRGNLTPAARRILQPGRIGRWEVAPHAQQGAAYFVRRRAVDIHRPRATSNDVLACGHRATAVLVILRNGPTESRGFQGDAHPAIERGWRLRTLRTQRRGQPLFDAHPA